MDHVESVRAEHSPEWVHVLVPVHGVAWQAQVMLAAIRADLGRDEVSAADALDWMTTSTDRLAAAIARKVAAETVEPPHIRIGEHDLRG
jgi:flavorubredoxin